MAKNPIEMLAHTTARTIASDVGVNAEQILPTILAGVRATLVLAAEGVEFWEEYGHEFIGSDRVKYSDLLADVKTHLRTARAKPGMKGS